MLDDVSLTIRPRSHYAILGARGAGKTTFLHLLSGTLPPTGGWVEKRASVSSSIPLVRFGTGTTTPRQLARRLAKVYYTDPAAVADFVADFTELGKAMDVPTRFLTRHARQKLGLALFYGLPCDFYLYDRVINSKLPDMKERVEQAYARRREHAGMIFVTSDPRSARWFGGGGGIIHQGKVALYDTVEEAIAEYERLNFETVPAKLHSDLRLSADPDEIED